MSSLLRNHQTIDAQFRVPSWSRFVRELEIAAWSGPEPRSKEIDWETQSHWSFPYLQTELLLRSGPTSRKDTLRRLSKNSPPYHLQVRKMRPHLDTSPALRNKLLGSLLCLRFGTGPPRCSCNREG